MVEEASQSLECSRVNYFNLYKSAEKQQISADFSLVLEEQANMETGTKPIAVFLESDVGKDLQFTHDNEIELSGEKTERIN